jgi:hypothetical protein
VHLARGQRDVGSAVVADQETVAVGMALEAADDGRASRCKPGPVVDEDVAAGVKLRGRLVERA